MNKPAGLFALLLFCFLQSSFSRILYVSPSGSDENSGLSPDSSLATLQHAADIAGSGDSVTVENGDYAGFDMRTAGSESGPIVFKAAGDDVNITSENFQTPDGINIEGGDWIVIDGFKIADMERAGIRIVTAQHVTARNNFCTRNGRWGIFTGFSDYAVIEGNECSYSVAEHGIYYSNSGDHPLIRGNVSHHNNSCGIHMNGDASMGGDGVISYAVVEGNIIYENGAAGGSGINCDGVSHSRIFNNLLYSNHASGISLYMIDAAQGASNNLIFNNTVINADDARWCLNIADGSVSNTVINNIFINLHSFRGAITMDDASLTGFSGKNNILTDRLSMDGDNTIVTVDEWETAGMGSGNMAAGAPEDLFADWAGGDYHLKAGSPAVDAGVGSDSVAEIILTDLDGHGRPIKELFDIGAYEYFDPLLAGDRQVSFIGAGRVQLKNGRSGMYLTGLLPEDHVRIFDVNGTVILNAQGITGGTLGLSNPKRLSGWHLVSVTHQGKPVCLKKILL